MSALSFILAICAVLVLALWVLSSWIVRATRMDCGDNTLSERVGKPDTDSPEMAQVLSMLRDVNHSLHPVPRRQKLQATRQALDDLFANRKLDIVSNRVNAGGVPAQWVMAPNAISNQRLLYIHGGGFYAGSTFSHRTITAKLSAVTSCAVLAIDYRLMPEHSRQAGIDDCRTAYDWMLKNGPEGQDYPTPAHNVYVAGDSAGGNLTLALLLWLRDHGLRAPDAAIVLSPITDACFNSASLRSNLKSDRILGPIYKLLLRVPRRLLLLGHLIQTRMSPKQAQISPLYGDLSGLPPMLIHASESEVLYDDARRFAKHALEAGSPVKLQTWPGMMHVWHIFNPDLPQAEQAFEEIAKFIRSCPAPLHNA